MKILRKLRSLFRRNQFESEMSDEMRLHLDLQTQKNIAAGVEVNEAYYASKRQFGGVEQIKERCREQRGGVWLEQVGRDLVSAFRHLRKVPRFSAVAVASLGLGIGVSTALFSVLDARLLRSIPVSDPDSLTLFEWAPASPASAPRDYDFNVGTDGSPATGQTRLHFPREIVERFANEHRMLSDVCATANLFAMTVVIDGVAEFVSEGQLVSGNYYAMLGVPAWNGRVLSPDDDRTGAPPVCLISHAFSQRDRGRPPKSSSPKTKTRRGSGRTSALRCENLSAWRGANGFGLAHEAHELHPKNEGDENSAEHR